jgi:hypothetical protein
MMNIDIRTPIVVLGITNFLQVTGIFLQYRINKSYRGIGWWLLGFLSLTVGFLFSLLRDVMTLKLITIIVSSASFSITKAEFGLKGHLTRVPLSSFQFRIL